MIKIERWSEIVWQQKLVYWYDLKKLSTKSGVSISNVFKGHIFVKLVMVYLLILDIFAGKRVTSVILVVGD